MPEHDHHLDGIQNAPMTTIPVDTIRTYGPIKIMLGRAPGRTISVGLLFEAQPPLGDVEIYLTGDQLQGLAEQIQTLINLSSEETEALIDRLNTEEAA